MRKLFFLFALFSFTVTAIAQESLGGIWLGGIKVNGITLRLAFHITKSPTGFAATMDSIDQGAKGLPVTLASRKGDTVVFKMDNIGGMFLGKFLADKNTIDGTWSQGGSDFPLTLKRADATAVEMRRPQTPAKPYPYREEEVILENKSAAITLAGTLTMPSTKGPFAAVVLITGSGPQNRDEEILGHRPFLVLSDYLTRKGIAVLRVDDRGIGKSKGNFAVSTTADFATDTEAAVEYLKSRPEIDAKKIGLIGHSEGGTIASMVAAHNPDVAFIVMMAGSAVPGDQIIPEQVRMGARLGGAPKEKVDEAVQRERAALAMIKGERNSPELTKKLHDLMLAASMPEPRINAEIAAATSPWYRYFLTYDPAPALRKVTCPVLALYGSLDTQVPPWQNLPPMRKAFEEGKNKRVEIDEFAGVNHLFQTARTGSVSEYAQIEETMSPIVLEKIATWIAQN